MARQNQQAGIETAATLLQQIKASAENTVDPSSLLQLAEAFALVNTSDLRRSPAPPLVTKSDRRNPPAPPLAL